MSEQKQPLKARISHKHKTEAEWLQVTDFIPKAGEMVVYDPDTAHASPRLKIGDGERTINELEFIGVIGEDADTKNTTGATPSTKKLYLVGAQSQGTNPQTYTRTGTYIGADGEIYTSANGDSPLVAKTFTEDTYVKKSTKINGIELSGDITLNTESEYRQHCWLKETYKYDVYNWVDYVEWQDEYYDNRYDYIIFTHALCNVPEHLKILNIRGLTEAERDDGDWDAALKEKIKVDADTGKFNMDVSRTFTFTYSQEQTFPNYYSRIDTITDSAEEISTQSNAQETLASILTALCEDKDLHIAAILPNNNFHSVIIIKQGSKITWEQFEDPDDIDHTIVERFTSSKSIKRYSVEAEKQGSESEKIIYTLTDETPTTEKGTEYTYLGIPKDFLPLGNQSESGVVTISGSGELEITLKRIPKLLILTGYGIGICTGTYGNFYYWYDSNVFGSAFDHMEHVSLTLSYKKTNDGKYTISTNLAKTKGSQSIRYYALP